MYYTGIDLHKFTSYLTTVDSSGKIVKEADIKNVNHNFVQYFSDLGNENITTVESTMTWYWLNDLLTSLNIPLVLAHAKYVKAIAYAKVKPIRSTLILSHSFFAWTTFRLLIKSPTINGCFVMLCVLDLKSCSVIHLLPTPCSFYLLNTTSILQMD